MRRCSRTSAFGFWILASVSWVASAPLMADVPPEVQRDLDADALDRDALDEDFRAKLTALAVRCRQLELSDQAQITSSWFVDRDPRRLYLFLPADTDFTKPEAAAEEVVHQWYSKFMLYRREYAASLFRLATAMLDRGDAPAAYQLLYEILREDPDHSSARRVLGFRRRGSGWRRASTRITRRRVGTTHPKFGWRRNEYWRIESRHFRVLTSCSPEEGTRLARQLETFHDLWQQVFFAHWSTGEALAARLAGHNELLGRERKHKVVQFRDRQEYVKQLAQLEPQIAVSLGYYMHGRRTSFFYAGKESLRATWFHEATHQLFQESGEAIERVGEKWNSWILEGIAVYMESLVPHRGYWTLGGFDADRLQYARARMLSGGKYTPLSELVRLGREDLQRHPDIRRIYTQSAGLVHFFMNGSNARFRRAIIDLLRAQYQGRDSTRSLVLLTGTDFNELDDQYRQFLQVSEQDLRFLNPPPFVRSLILGRSAITDDGLKRLADHQQLEWLDLSFTAVTDTGIDLLAGLTNLKQLSLEGTRVTNRSLNVIANFGDLEELDLSGTEVTDAGVKKLAALGNLKVLWLSDTAITDETLTVLTTLKKLEYVDVDKTQVTSDAWLKFSKVLERNAEN